MYIFCESKLKYNVIYILLNFWGHLIYCIGPDPSLICSILEKIMENITFLDIVCLFCRCCVMKKSDPPAKRWCYMMLLRILKRGLGTLTRMSYEDTRVLYNDLVVDFVIHLVTPNLKKKYSLIYPIMFNYSLQYCNRYIVLDSCIWHFNRPLQCIFDKWKKWLDKIVSI